MNHSINGVVLESVDSEKDFGVIVDSKLRFHCSTVAAVKRVNQMLGILKKSYVSRDAATRWALYKAVI